MFGNEIISEVDMVKRGWPGEAHFLKIHFKSLFNFLKNLIENDFFSS